jgi:hypothetical protein
MGIKETLVAAAGKAAGDVMKGLDGLFTSDDERLGHQATIQAAMNDLTKAHLDAAAADESERTDRHQTDMKSDSWMSKNIRPVTLIFLMGFYTVIAITDSIGTLAFDVKPAYISLLETLMMTAFGFYFVMRGAEKITKIARKT